MVEKRQVDLPHASWWGRFELENGQAAQWTMGSLKLAVQRLPAEWQIAYERDELTDPETAKTCLTIDALNVKALNYAHTERYVLDQTGEVLWLKPALADRPMVTRPITPVYVPPGEQIIIFVSSPLWVRIEVGDPPRKLQEVPIQRPSDTWFGPSTMEGELCYAGRTNARLSFENIAVRSHRAVTPVTIYNRATSQLLVERLSLPVPYLSLFATSEGALWTQAVTMARTRDTGMATLDIETGPPGEAGQAKPVGEPRFQPEQNMVVRAFGALFR